MSFIEQWLHDAVPALVGSEWRKGQQSFAVDNPATGETIARVAEMGADDTRDAVAAAYEAGAAWRATPVKQRSALLRRWFELINEHADDLARLMTLEQGKPLAEAKGEVTYGASFIEFFAEEAKRMAGETLPSHGADKRLLVLREPVGVVAAITPWNFPLAMITRKCAPALAAGCTVVIKPAEATPLTALAAAYLALEAGLPAGTINVVTASKPADVGEVLTTDPRVRKVSFTGSTPVGKHLLAQCASTVKKTAMELGGNAPFIVGPDMDPKQAAYAAVDAKFQTAGQDCLAANRILVHESIHDEFVEQFAERMAALTVGNGLQGEIDLGPLIHRQAVEKAAAIVDDAISKGAKMIGGDQSQAPGENFFMPVMLTGVTPKMKVWREENFAPVAGITAYSTDDEVIEMSNDTEYGLAAYIYTHDIRRIWKLMRALEYGMVSVNSVKMTGPPVPFGGVKQSGLGREGGATGIDEYLETKYYCLGALGSVSGS